MHFGNTIAIWLYHGIAQPWNLVTLLRSVVDESLSGNICHLIELADLCLWKVPSILNVAWNLLALP